VTTPPGTVTLPNAFTVQLSAAGVATTSPQPITEVEEGGIRSGYLIITPDSNSAAPIPTATFGIVTRGAVQSQAGMFPGPMMTDGTLFVEVVPGIGRNLGIANPGSSTNTVTLTLRDVNGTITGTPVTLVLQPRQQLARFVSELFLADVVGSGFRGNLRVQSSSPVALLSPKSG